MPDHRIVSNEAAHYLYDGDTMVATGSRELCEAVRDGTVPAYIEKLRAEREKLGIGEYGNPDRGASKRKSSKKAK